MAISEYDHGAHWVSQRIDAGLPFGVDHPIIVGAVKFGLVWDVLAIAYTVTQWRHIDHSFLVASALGLLWVNLAPFFIWYYDERVLPAFFAQAADLLPDATRRQELAEKYTRKFAEHRIWVSAFWGGSLVTIVHLSRPVLRSQGMTGGGAVFLLTTYLYALYIGVVLGHGFVGPMTTLRLVRELTKLDIEIDPLHPDNLGGLSTVGYCAIRTTLLFSTASLFLPLLFRLVAGERSATIIFATTGIYILTVLASFVYPTIKVNRRAQELREEILDDLRRQYATIEKQMNPPGENEIAELNHRLELQRVQSKYENYNSVRLYPMQVDILIRLGGSILLPILFMILEFRLQDIL